jgi:GNAT superfamily N-acetyltransferase
MWEMLIAGMWQIPFRFGWDTLQRLVTLLNAMEGAMGKVQGKGDEQDFIMLQRMVVLPQCQGQGVGSRALRDMLSSSETTATTTTTSSSSMHIHLDTQEECNVRFYEQLGWTVTGGRQFFEDDAEYKFFSWQMIHTGTS